VAGLRVGRAAMGQERVLVVEDDEPIAELIRHTLARAGYRVTCFTSGEKLLVHAGSEPPDLVLLDLMLPGVDGLEICRLLRGESSGHGWTRCCAGAPGSDTAELRREK
jgi:DNA-binding response OmpR family regulator